MKTRYVLAGMTLFALVAVAAPAMGEENGTANLSDSNNSRVQGPRAGNGTDRPTSLTAKTTADPPNTVIIFPDRKIQTKGSSAKVRFSYACVTDDSLGENTCDFFECRLDGSGWRRCPGGASDPGADDPTYRIKATRSWRTHVFAVRVTDTNGKTAPTPAKWRFKVRRFDPRQAFSGVWTARDRDGSRQRVRFSGAGNRRTLKYRDSSSSACPRKGPEKLTGKGRIKGKRLIGHWRTGKCTRSGDKLGGAGKLRFRWRPSTNTLKDNWGSVWKRRQQVNGATRSRLPMCRCGRFSTRIRGRT